MSSYFKDDKQRGIMDTELREQLLQKCSFMQLLTERQCNHIKEAIKDRNAKVCCERGDDQTLRWTVDHEVG